MSNRGPAMSERAEGGDVVSKHATELVQRVAEAHPEELPATTEALLTYIASLEARLRERTDTGAGAPSEQAKSTKMKPCPLCGSDMVQLTVLEYDDPDNPLGWRPNCIECGLTASAYLDEARAVEKWNCRDRIPAGEEKVSDDQIVEWCTFCGSRDRTTDPDITMPICGECGKPWIPGGPAKDGGMEAAMTILDWIRRSCELHKAAAEALPDSPGDIHRELLADGQEILRRHQPTDEGEGEDE